MNKQKTEQNKTNVLLAGRDTEAAGGQRAVQERVAHLQQGQELRRVRRHRHREAGVDGAHQEGQKQFLARDFDVLFEQQFLLISPTKFKYALKIKHKPHCFIIHYKVFFFNLNLLSIVA